MKLKKLIEGLPLQIFRGSKEVEITGLCSHSKYVAPGDLFIAKMGAHDDGSQYIDEALASGAAAILTDFVDPSLKTTQVLTEDVRAAEALLAARFYDSPSQELFAIGVTGTNGKTTTSHLIHYALHSGLIGTIEYVIGDFHFDAELTTPDIITNQKLLREMVKQGCKSAVIEVSSHGLAQKRTEGIDFDVAIFTNLSQDHLDYHQSMEEYAATKAKLFRDLKKEATAVVPHNETFMIKECSAHILTYGIGEGDVSATDLHLASDHTTFKVDGKAYKTPLVGRFNVLNTLAALAACRVYGKTDCNFEDFPSVRGRVERVHGNVYVDFAHTPAALENVLLALREFAPARILTVFGAGGDRDRDKRRKMGEVVAKHADFAILTSDNPRSEDPQKICEEIAVGCPSALIEIDRRRAIERAIALADSDDIVLIAGKGHETCQIFAHRTMPFDDRKVVLEILDEVRCT